MLKYLEGQKSYEFLTDFVVILSNFSPLGAVKDINIFEKLFYFFKAHIKRQLLVALPYQGSNFIFFAMAFTPPY